MTTMHKTKIVNVVLWAAYLLTLAASVSHLAWAFGTLEFEGSQWIGWLAALAVDAGLAALAYGVQQRKRAHHSARDLWVGVLLFAGISAFANLLHGLTSVTGSTVEVTTFDTIDLVALVKAIVLSATLPLLIVYLGEIVSSGDTDLNVQSEPGGNSTEQTDRTLVVAEQMPVSSSVGMTSIPASLEQARAVRAELAEQTKVQVLDTLANQLSVQPDTSVSDLAKLVGRSRTTVYSYLAELENAGRIQRNGHDQADLAGLDVNQ